MSVHQSVFPLRSKPAGDFFVIIKYKELADIKEIVKLTDVDDETIRKYFKKYHLGAYYDETAGK